MPKRRIPKKEVNLDQQIEAFGNLAEVSTGSVDFEQLSLDDLAQQYREIDQQSHLLKGKIILAARSKFNSDRQFGAWLSDNLSDLNPKQAHRLMCLADFFNEKSNLSMKGISISACYELSAPKNRPIARDVYFEVAGRGLPLEEVREKLSNKFNEYQVEQQKRLATDSSQSLDSEPILEVTDKIPEFEIAESDQKTPTFNHHAEQDRLINVTLAGLSNKEKLDFLAECIAVIKKY